MLWLLGALLVLFGLYQHRWKVLDTVSNDVVMTKAEAEKKLIPDVVQWYEEATTAAQIHDVPNDLVLSIIDQESDGNGSIGLHPDGVSYGLMGLTPIGAEAVGIQDRKALSNHENILAGAEYLRKMLEKHREDGSDEPLWDAVRSYNKGPSLDDPQDGARYAADVFDRIGREGGS
jgi:membrane-bound lytic murein transglycosylase MltF